MTFVNHLRLILLFILIFAVCTTYAGTVSFSVNPRVEVNLTDFYVGDVAKGGPLILEGKAINEGNVQVTVSPMALISMGKSGRLVKSIPFTLAKYNDEEGYLACMDTRDLEEGNYSATVVMYYYNDYYSGFVEEERNVNISAGMIPKNASINLSAPESVLGSPGSTQIADVVIENHLDHDVSVYLFSKNDQDVLGCSRVQIAAGEVKRESVEVLVPYDERNITLVAIGPDGYSNEVSMRVTSQIININLPLSNEDFLVISVFLVFLIVVFYSSKKKRIKIFNEADREHQDIYDVGRIINLRH